MDQPKWRLRGSGDWSYELDGDRIGSVVFQKDGARKVWYSVSALMQHDLEQGSLRECKARIERLYAGRMSG